MLRNFYFCFRFHCCPFCLQREITASGAAAGGHTMHPLAAIFAEYMSCPEHRTIMLKMCAIIQTITLRCPTALVWNWLGDGKTSLFICGSPLDLLPCFPSSLPMLPAPNKLQVSVKKH
jgi:mediator of RNA polymerase II transcription subunit 12